MLIVNGNLRRRNPTFLNPVRLSRQSLLSLIGVDEGAPPSQRHHISWREGIAIGCDQKAALEQPASPVIINELKVSSRSKFNNLHGRMWRFFAAFPASCRRDVDTTPLRDPAGGNAMQCRMLPIGAKCSHRSILYALRHWLSNHLISTTAYNVYYSTTYAVCIRSRFKHFQHLSRTILSRAFCSRAFS